VSTSQPSSRHPLCTCPELSWNAATGRAPAPDLDACRANAFGFDPHPIMAAADFREVSAQLSALSARYLDLKAEETAMTEPTPEPVEPVDPSDPTPPRPTGPTAEEPQQVVTMDQLAAHLDRPGAAPAPSGYAVGGTVQPGGTYVVGEDPQ